MMIEIIGIVFGLSPIIILGILLYCMFVTKRTVLRIFGWAISIFTIGFIFIHAYISASSGYTGMDAMKIVFDLQNLRSATLLFYKEFETWPLPGQEASLDAFCDRRTVLAAPPIFAKVTLADKPGDADSPSELYIGVELIPERNGTAGIQEYLARRAIKVGILQQPASDGIYKSGLSVYMRVY
jgi:hypothetical protein